MARPILTILPSPAGAALAQLADLARQASAALRWPGPAVSWGQAVGDPTGLPRTILSTDRACLLESPSAAPCLLTTWQQAGLLVVMDGYLAREDYSADGPSDAAFVADCYQRTGPAGIQTLDGSFRLFLFDEAAATVHVWTDRVGTMPLFTAWVGDVLLVVPNTRCLRSIDGVDRRLVPGSLASMALNGSLLDEHTYWSGVQLLGPARHLEICEGRVHLHRYWQRSFAEGKDAPSAEQVTDAITRATARHVKRFARPMLALSGGLDSRVLLAACRRAGLDVPAVSWGVDRLGDPRADFQVGCQVARALGVSHVTRPMNLDLFAQHARDIVHLTDGLTGHLGNYPEGLVPSRQFAAQCDALLFGNEMFGFRGLVQSPLEAVQIAGITVGRRLKLLRFLLRRDVARQVLDDYRCQYLGLLASIGLDLPACDIKDILYWRTRFPRLIVSQAEVYRDSLHYISPLLDADVLELTRPLTAQHRCQKQYLSECVERGFAQEFALPLSRHSSRADWARRLGERGPAQRFIIETLLAPGSAFDGWFDRDRIRAWLGWSMAQGPEAPWPNPIGALGKVGLGAASLALRPTFRDSIVLNLLTLRLWMS